MTIVLNAPTQEKEKYAPPAWVRVIQQKRNVNNKTLC